MERNNTSSLDVGVGSVFDFAFYLYRNFVCLFFHHSSVYHVGLFLLPYIAIDRDDYRLKWNRSNGLGR